MRRLLLIVALFAPSLALGAENITTFRLQNGMEAVVIEDHRTPVVTHMVWYRTGAADEEAGKSGIAHFLEHLLFKGTDDREAGEFSRIIAANGGTENAFTSYDYTAYFQRVAADRLDLMMEMEADRMRDLVLTNEDVATERDVVLEERNSRTENNPGALFSEQRSAALYLNHPYGVPIIGWKHEIEQLNRTDAFAFYKKYYAPNNAILVVAGDVDPRKVETLAKMFYGPLEPSDDIIRRKRPTEPPQISPRRLTYSDVRVAQPYVIRSYIATERNEGDQREAAALTLLAELLGGSGITSVLGQKLQVEETVAVHTAAFYDGMSLDKSSFGLVIVPAEGVSLQESEDAVDEVIADFMTEGIDSAHFARIKTQIRASQIYALDDQSRLARRYGEALTSGLTIEDVAAWPEILQSISEEEIIAAARNVFNLDQSVTGWLMRKEEGAAE